MINEQGRYRMDFDGLKEINAEKCESRLLLFSS